MRSKYLNLIQEKENFWYLFVFLCLINVLSLYVIHDIIITDPQYFTGGKQSSVDLYRTISKAVYIVYPLYCFIKIAIISTLLLIGLRLWRIEIPFRQLMVVSIIAEIAYWIKDLAQIIWFLVIHPDYTMKEVDNFSFLSLQFIAGTNASDTTKALLNLISVPEVLFILALIYGLKTITSETLRRIVTIVLGTYGISYVAFVLIKESLF